MKVTALTEREFTDKQISESFRTFRSNFINGAGNLEWRFKEIFGDISLPEAYSIWVEENERREIRNNKIDDFELFLRMEGLEPQNSNISESRYYYYNGIKYRFSGHVYPTGSMTNEILGVVDLAADPHLIDDVKFTPPVVKYTEIKLKKSKAVEIKKSEEIFNIGDRVVNKKFGEGEVIEQGEVIIVKFDNEDNVRKFPKDFAPIKKIK